MSGDAKALVWLITVAAFVLGSLALGVIGGVGLGTIVYFFMHLVFAFNKVVDKTTNFIDEEINDEPSQKKNSDSH